MSAIETLGFRIAIGHAVRATLIGRPRSALHPSRGRFTDHEVRAILWKTWRYERRATAHVPPGLSARDRHNLRLAGFALALLDTLLLRKVERSHALALVADVAWKLASLWVDAADRPPCPAAGGLRATPDGVEATSCLVAQYLRAHDAADLCHAAWCDLTYSIAERDGRPMVRDDATIADGAEACRMHWRES